MQVAKNYIGLAHLVINLVEALKNKDLYAWNGVLEQLTNFDFDGCFYSKVHSTIELSYNHFEFYGYNIKDMLVFGLCLGLHKHSDMLADGRSKLYKLIDNLRDAYFLVGGESDSVAALEVVHNVAVSIGSKVKSFFTTAEGGMLLKVDEAYNIFNKMVDFGFSSSEICVPNNHSDNLLFNQWDLRTISLFSY
ncbi:hypothetical protein RYX36_029463 [Vicia faba]